MNATVYTGEEFGRKAQSRDPFFERRTPEDAKQFVKGSEHELEAILAKGEVKAHQTSRQELDNIRALIMLGSRRRCPRWSVRRSSLRHGI